jgi:hypothetical protein
MNELRGVRKLRLMSAINPKLYNSIRSGSLMEAEEVHDQFKEYSSHLKQADVCLKQGDISLLLGTGEKMLRFTSIRNRPLVYCLDAFF